MRPTARRRLPSVVPRAALLALLATSPAGAAGPGAGPADATAPDCRCRMPGGALRELGTVECVEIGPQRVRVRCEMSTNTPYWRPLGPGSGGCPAPA